MKHRALEMKRGMKTAAAHIGRPARVLIVDDDVATARTLKLLIEGRIDAETTLSHDATSTRHQVDTTPYDIVTLDYQLPDGNGLEVLSHIRSLENPPPVIMVTGHGDEEVASQSLLLGACGYVVKDTRLKTMLTVALEKAMSEIALRRAEDSLRESEDRYRALYYENPSMLFTLDESGGVVSANEFGAGKLGYGMDDIIGRPFVGLFHGDDRETVAGKLEDCLSAPGRVISWQSRKVLRDGAVMWVEDYARAVTGPGGDRNILVVCHDITERKTAEERMSQAYEYLENLIDWLPDATFVLDDRRRILYWNRAIEEMTGIPKEIMIGKDGPEAAVPFYGAARPMLVDLMDREDEELARQYEYIEHKGRTVFGEAFAPGLKGGKGGYILAIASPLYNSEGRLVASIESMRDISDYKNIAEELRMERDKARLFLDTVNSIFVAINREGRVIFANRKCCEVLGCMQEEIVGRDWFETYVPPEDRPRAKFSFERMLSGDVGADEIFENSIAAPGASPRLISWRHNCIRDEAGGITGTISSGEDITDRDYQALFNAANDAIFVHDMDTGKILDVNRKMLEMWGYTKEEVLGFDIGDVSSGEPPYSQREAVEYVRKSVTDGPQLFEWVGKDAGGNLFWLEVNLKIAHLGGKQRVLAIVRDISERKAAQETLRAELETRQEREKELASANLELQRFTHAVSHDLKGPISTLSTGLQIVRSHLEETDPVDGGDEGITQLVFTLIATANNSYQLVEELLALAQTGQVPGDVEEVEVREVVDLCLESHRESIQEKGIRIVLDEDLGTLMASRTHLYQLFSNIISNGIKHNTSRDPSLEVRYLGIENGANRYLVRDNGPGVPEDYIASGFTPFYKSKRGGTVVGLAIADRVVRVYEGKMHVYNDGGACFDFLLRDYYRSAPSD